MPPPDSPAASGHLARIDVLRACAILLVFGLHLLISTLGMVAIPWKGPFRDYPDAWPFHDFGLLVPLTYGWSGVALFFVISGFCIHHQRIHSRGSSFGNFFWKRFTRLYPAYLVSLLIMIAWDYHQDHALVTLGGVLSHLFLVHNLSLQNFASINGVYWSLGVEFQFYLLYPLLIVSMKRSSLQRCFAEAVALNVLGFVFFSWVSPDSNIHVDVYRSFPLMTWCTWILGACLAESYAKGERCFVRPKFMLGLSLALLIFAMNFKPLIGEAFLFAAVFFAVVIESYVVSPQPLNWRERCLIPIGLISYSIYLWHGPLLALTAYAVGGSGIANAFLIVLPLALILILLVSTASYFLLEVGARRWLTNLFRG